MRFVTVAASILLFSTSTAYADRAEADRCASTLPPVSKTLYDQSLAEVLGGETPRDALTANARAMVMGSSLSRTDARSAAEAAAPCLQLAR